MATQAIPRAVPLPDLEDLRIFVNVARTGNMSAAGRALGLSAAVVSKRIKALEERLEVRLLQRSTRQLALTDIGEALFKRALDILALTEDFVELANKRINKVRGLVKLCAPASFANMLILPSIERFFDEYPEIRIDMTIVDAPVDVVGEGVDLSIQIGELTDSTLIAKRLAPVNAVICASAHYLRSQGEPKTLRDLDNHNCLILEGNETWALEEGDAGQEFRPSGNLTVNSSDHLRQAVLAGLGIGMLPSWEVAGDLREGRLKVVLPNLKGARSHSIFAVYHSRDNLPERVRCLIEFIGGVVANATRA